MRMRSPQAKKRSRFAAGFSLVELLMVVAILAILAVAGTAALGDRKSTKARSGAEVLEALFGQARTHAVLNRVPTRVVVQTEYREDKPEDYLRAVAIMAEESSGVWTQVTPWTRLPEGVFFAEERSTPDDDDESFTITVPGGGVVDRAYYDFAANGQRTGSAKVVVEEGSLVDGKFVGRGDEAAHGFMVYPMGQRVFLSLAKIKEVVAE